jgi:glycosyltransferase involved in cell wall biosynthesis
MQAFALARRARPAVVHANDWNTMWSGVAIKLFCKARLIYDSHELWPDRNGRWECRAWLLACEALFVRIADRVLTSSPGYADVLAQRYRIARPKIVRNIPSHASVVTRPRAMVRRRELEGPGAPPWLAYVGGLMPGRGLEQTIDALALVPELRLRAVGPGASGYKLTLLERAQRAGVADRVELHPPVAPEQVTSVIDGAAAGVCLIQPVCRSYELCLPNKLFEYAGAGLPVIASDVSILAEVVRANGLGVVAPASEPRAIATSLERLLEPHGWRQTARRATEFARTHSWQREARTLAGVYVRAIGWS